MATVTHAVTTPDSGNTPNASGAFTPAANDLLIVFVGVEGSLNDPGILSSSVGGQSFTQVLRTTYASGSAAFYVFVANVLSTAVSQTVTIESGGDAGAGSNISVYRVAGMTNTGLTAIRQSAAHVLAGGGTPAPSFGVAALTTNCCLGAVANGTNPATLDPPSGWTEGSDTGYSTGIVNGIETCFRNSGETGTTITWVEGSASSAGALIVELDTSAPAGIPDLNMATRQPPSRRAQ